MSQTHDTSGGFVPTDDRPKFALIANSEDRYLGTVIGDRYKVLSLLGKGGMGSVYRAQHTALGKIQAIKVLKQSALENNTALNRFDIEAKAASSLNHPNLVSVHDYGLTAEGAPYLVMDFVEGVSLLDVLLRDGALNSVLVIELFEQICDGLAYAHSQGVVHRDIKPSNIILTRTASGAPQIKIVDFGIAKIVGHGEAEHELTQTGEVFGSPMYMSPEQCEGQREVDARSDIYSVACVMYEALTGQPPFTGTNAIQTMYKQINEAPSPMDGANRRLKIPPSLENVVMRALEKKPSERYQTMEELRNDLQLIKSGGVPNRTRSQLWFNRKPVRKRILVYTLAIFIGTWLGITAASLYALAPVIFMPEWQRTLHKANNNLRRGRYDFAEQGYVRAMSLVDKSNETASTRAFVRSNFADFNLLMADNEEDNNQTVRALHLYEEAQELISTDLKGKPSIEESSYVGRQGDCYFRMGKYPKAIQLFRQAIAIGEIAPGTFDKAELYYRLGRAYSAENKPKDAEISYRHALDEARKTKDFETLECAKYYHFLANSLVAQQRFTEADLVFKLSEQLRKRISGDNTPVYLATLADHAALLMKMNETGQARNMLNYVKQHRHSSEVAPPL
ncbi:MAG: serine/threonine-protein kinase [Candidatus Obscuribacterales bacterium]